MLVKTVLNRCHPLKGFTYGSCRFHVSELVVEVSSDRRTRAKCGQCGEYCSTYDTARRPRRFAFIPLWGFAVFLVYHLRRVSCPHCGITTEALPWAQGKQRCCNAYRSFLARWARRMPWSEVARVFDTSWNVVSRAVEWVVDYGLEHRSLDGVNSIGVDEVSIRKGQDYLTLVYQIDEGARRLLWVGQKRTEKCFEEFFNMFGERRIRDIQFVASDMCCRSMTSA